VTTLVPRTSYLLPRTSDDGLTFLYRFVLCYLVFLLFKEIKHNPLAVSSNNSEGIILCMFLTEFSDTGCNQLLIVIVKRILK
jgi:hypothetical protein